MNRSKSGQVKVGVIVLVAAVLVGVLYFTSDVFRTKIKVAADQYAHWTPENIAKDPENYLNFCEQEATKALGKLKASQISIAQNHATLEASQKAAAEKIALGGKALGELKQAFKDATAANKWPITWNGRSLDQEAVKRQVISFSREVASAETLKSKVEDGIKKLDVQVSKVQEANSQANEQIAQIKTSREMLKVQKITDDLSKQLSTIGATLQATIGIASDTSGPMNLDQLKTESATTVNEDEFKKIMGN